MDGAPPDDNYDALPLEQRLTHKVPTLPCPSLRTARPCECHCCPPPTLTDAHTPPAQVWKARLSAYAEVASLASKTPDDADPFFHEPFLSPSSLRDWVRDANAVAQEKGVEAACAVVEFGGRAMARCAGPPRLCAPRSDSLTRSRTLRTRAEVVPSVVEKCLGSTRVRAVIGSVSPNSRIALTQLHLTGQHAHQGHRALHALCRSRGRPGRGCHCALLSLPHLHAELELTPPTRSHRGMSSQDSTSSSQRLSQDP